MAYLRNSTRGVAAALIAVAALGTAAAGSRAAPGVDCPDPGAGFPVVVVADIGQKAEVPAETIELSASVGITDILYEPASTDTRVVEAGEALADFVRCVARSSSTAGGPGRLVIAAVSTGVLVTRMAAVILERSGELYALAGVSTVGGPEEGFWMDSPDFGSDEANDAGTRALFLAEAASTCDGGAPAPLDEVCALLEPSGDDSDLRFVASEEQLSALPPWPDGMRVDRIGGEIEIYTDVFGRSSLHLGDVGDGVVAPSAASMVVPCHYNLAAPTRAKDSSCAHSRLGLHDTTINLVWSLVASTIAGSSPGGFLLVCGTLDNPERLSAVLNVPAGAEVYAPSAGFRYLLEFGDNPPELDYFEYGPERPRFSGSQQPGDGQRFIDIIGPVLFDETIRPGDPVAAGQVIGHVRNTPQYVSYGAVGGTVRVSASVLRVEEQRQIATGSPDNDFLKTLFDFPQPAFCVSSDG